MVLGGSGIIAVNADTAHARTHACTQSPLLQHTPTALHTYTPLNCDILCTACVHVTLQQQLQRAANGDAHT